MIKSDELKRGWQKITILRDVKDRTQDYSVTPLSINEFDVLCFIAHQTGNATITSMVNHPYFKGVSISTIKRAVLSLTEAGLIGSSEGDDRRERYLSVVEEVDNV